MTLAAKILFLLLLGLGVMAVTVQVFGARRAASAEAAFPPQGVLLDVGGITVHAVQMGADKGTAPDLVLIHGASGNWRDMTFRLAPALADRYRIIIFDRPGLGYSDRTSPEYASAFTSLGESPAEQAAILQAAAAQLGADRPIVLGHSYGGAVSLAWAVNHPDNIAAVIDVSGVANPWPGKLDILYRINGTALGGAIVPPILAAVVPETTVEAAIDSIFTPDPVPEGYSRFVAAGLSVRSESLRANARQVNSLRPRVVEMQPKYSTITAPLEIIHGTADTIVPATIHSIPLAAQVAGANLILLDGVGHMPHQTHTKDVIAAIDRAAARARLN